MNEIPSRKPLVISEEVPEVIKVAIWEKDHLLFLKMRFHACKAVGINILSNSGTLRSRLAQTADGWLVESTDLTFPECRGEIGEIRRNKELATGGSFLTLEAEFLFEISIGSRRGFSPACLFGPAENLL